MSQSESKNKDVACDCCHGEVPLSAALTSEGADYVYHFCSAGCYDKWCKQQNDEAGKR